MSSTPYDVIVVGYGPTGATAANLLGQLGLSTLVIERDLDVFPRQRAMAVDQDALRVWEGLGLLPAMAEGLHSDVRVHFCRRGRRILSFDGRPGDGQGHPGTSFFHQPTLEGALRAGASALDSVTVRVGEAVTALSQDDQGVSITTRDDRTRLESTYRSRYVIAADGGSSTVRKTLGIKLVGQQVAERWFDIQVQEGEPRQPGTPMDFMFLADPERPGVDCSSPGGYRRFEFELRPDEDEAEIDTLPGMRRVLAERGIDLDELEIFRHWAYTFHIRQAERWRDGRVMLAGDAAHLMPPFAGQGFSSGVRDVANLSWKLAAVVAGTADDTILDSYEIERRPNVVEHTQASVRIGGVVRTKSRFAAAVRDAAFRLVVVTPGLRGWVFTHMPRVEWRVGTHGVVASRRKWRSPAGRLVKQPTLVGTHGVRKRLDTLLGAGWAWVGLATATVPDAVVAAGIPVVRIGAPRDSWAVLPEGVFADMDGVLHAQLKRHRAKGFVVRPDRFIYGSDRDRLDDLLPLAAAAH